MLVLTFVGLFNVRGSDVAFNPVFLAYAMVLEKEIVLFTDEKRFDEQVARHLSGVKVLPYDSILDYIKGLKRGLKVAETFDVHFSQSQKVWLDPAQANAAIFSALDGHSNLLHRKLDSDAITATILRETPVQKMKAIKNGVCVLMFIMVYF